MVELSERNILLFLVVLFLLYLFMSNCGCRVEGLDSAPDVDCSKLKKKIGCGLKPFKCVWKENTNTCESRPPPPPSGTPAPCGNLGKNMCLIRQKCQWDKSTKTCKSKTAPKPSPLPSRDPATLPFITPNCVNAESDGYLPNKCSQKSGSQTIHLYDNPDIFNKLRPYVNQFQGDFASKNTCYEFSFPKLDKGKPVINTINGFINKGKKFEAGPCTDDGFNHFKSDGYVDMGNIGIPIQKPIIPFSVFQKEKGDNDNPNPHALSGLECKEINEDSIPQFDTDIIDNSGRDGNGRDDNEVLCNSSYDKNGFNCEWKEKKCVPGPQVRLNQAKCNEIVCNSKGTCVPNDCDLNNPDDPSCKFENTNNISAKDAKCNCTCIQHGVGGEDDLNCKKKPKDGYDVMMGENKTNICGKPSCGKDGAFGTCQKGYSCLRGAITPGKEYLNPDMLKQMGGESLVGESVMGFSGLLLAMTSDMIGGAAYKYADTHSCVFGDDDYVKSLEDNLDRNIVGPAVDAVVGEIVTETTDRNKFVNNEITSGHSQGRMAIDTVVEEFSFGLIDPSGWF
tara:strand:+ start:210 stop:1898 length:1689 start_codon:yes stop_codon:yes gene_type:complete